MEDRFKIELDVNEHYSLRGVVNAKSVEDAIRTAILENDLFKEGITIKVVSASRPNSLYKKEDDGTFKKDYRLDFS
jgi:hypothetical protein